MLPSRRRNNVWDCAHPEQNEGQQATAIPFSPSKIAKDLHELLPELVRKSLWIDSKQATIYPK
jgi:hypothetical protein